MENIKLKNLLRENMRRFGTKNISSINENEYSHLAFAKKKTYDDVRDDIASAAADLAEALETPKMEDLPVVHHAIQQLKKCRVFCLFTLLQSQQEKHKQNTN